MIESIPPWAIVVVVLFLFSIATFFLKILSNGGILIANAIGIAAFAFGGTVAFFALLVFYVLAELATWVGRKGEEKHAQRTSSNIFGNCAAAIAALFFGQYIAFFGAVSAAFADTVSSEIGLISKAKPVLITNLKKVEKGTDGGVTALGFAASLVAAAIIGAIYYFFVSASLKAFAAFVVSGFLGGAFDSFLGATFQRRGMLTNTQVNFFASIFGALVAVAIVNLF
ncbi:MAG TPA: DUF92 domain-containing protein [archaeon]|nr:DUF92 domain-containing protein [archaeon]